MFIPIYLFNYDTRVPSTVQELLSEICSRRNFTQIQIQIHQFTNSTQFTSIQFNSTQFNSIHFVPVPNLTLNHFCLFVQHLQFCPLTTVPLTIHEPFEPQNNFRISYQNSFCSRSPPGRLHPSIEQPAYVAT